MTLVSEVGSSILLFLLVFGMSATVDINNLRKQLGNRHALFTGAFLQFLVLPFLGFAVVKALDMSEAMGITLLVVTSSPGGSYSNWWCSMFNADLALSVTMTAISTLLSVVMLPINLVIYATSSYSGEVVKNLDWMSLFTSLVVVIGAIALGLYSSAKVRSRRFNLLANKLGNIAGVALVVFSAVISSSSEDAQLWDREWKFYLGVAAPCVLGLVVANIMTSCFRLMEPERVTVSVECCYQNVGIATSVAITMFSDRERAEAIGVPLYYGLVEALTLGLYCIFAWKIGWTKAPRDESFCVVILNSYEVEQAEMRDANAVEVVLGCPKDGLPSDLIFTYDEEEGYTVDEASLTTATQKASPDKTPQKLPSSSLPLSKPDSATRDGFIEEEDRVSTPPRKIISSLPASPTNPNCADLSTPDRTAKPDALDASLVQNSSVSLTVDTASSSLNEPSVPSSSRSLPVTPLRSDLKPSSHVQSNRSLPPSLNIVRTNDSPVTPREEEEPSNNLPPPIPRMEHELHSPPRMRGRRGSYNQLDDTRSERSLSPKTIKLRRSSSFDNSTKPPRQSSTRLSSAIIGRKRKEALYHRADSSDADNDIDHGEAGEFINSHHRAPLPARARANSAESPITALSSPKIIDVSLPIKNRTLD